MTKLGAYLRYPCLLCEGHWKFFNLLPECIYPVNEKHLLLTGGKAHTDAKYGVLLTEIATIFSIVERHEESIFMVE